MSYGIAAVGAIGLALALVSVPATAGAQPVVPRFPAPGEWPCYRGSGRLDARAAMRGEITAPKIAWKQFVGAVDTLLVAEPDARSATLQVPSTADTASPEAADPRWGLSPPQGEIGGRTQPVQRTVQVTYAHVLPEEPGLQKLEFESGFGKPTVNGQWQACVGRCFAWRDGNWAQVWETESLPMLFQPLPLVGDFDGDGNLEVAILPWYELVLYDARTGKLKDRCRFTVGRSYGFFGAYDLDGDGRSEFVVQADFCKHVDVLGYRGGQLSLLWQREIEPDISNPQRILRAPPCPVADVDGDGKLEVLISLYNGAGDGRWHLTVHDGISGAVKADLPDECLQGVADVDGDGASELLTVRTSGAGVPAFGRIAARRLRSGAVSSLWQGDGAAWQTWNPPLPPHVNSAATFAQRDVLWRRTGGRFTAVLRRPVKGKAEWSALTVASWNGNRLADGLQVEGPRLEGLALDEKGGLLARCITRPGSAARLSVRRGRARLLGSSPRGVPAGTAVVAREAGAAAPLVLVQGALEQEEVVSFTAPAGGEPGVERPRLAGRGQATSWTRRGQATNWPYDALGPVIADLRGDGGRQVLLAAAAPGGCARLAALDLAGKELWHSDFADIPGTPPVWNTGGIILWQVGHFTDRQRQDVLVTVRRSMMHSEETYLLSGLDGHPLWHRDRQISNRGAGGTPFAIADFDGDGLEDIASLHPSVLYMLKGSTGQDILAKDASWPGLPASIVYWGVPIAGDFDGSGRAGILFGTPNRSMIGLIRADGSLAWWDAFDKATTCLPALGDFDGGGKLQVVGFGFEDGIRCYEAATGQVKWQLPAPAAGNPSGTASADIDSDGREEVLFTLGNTLYCLGTDGLAGKGVLRWKLSLPAQVGAPSIADVDGSGKASILVVGVDGYVYCIQ